MNLTIWGDVIVHGEEGKAASTREPFRRHNARCWGKRASEGFGGTKGLLRRGGPVRVGPCACWTLSLGHLLTFFNTIVNTVHPVLVV